MSRTPGVYPCNLRLAVLDCHRRDLLRRFFEIPEKMRFGLNTNSGVLDRSARCLLLARAATGLSIRRRRSQSENHGQTGDFHRIGLPQRSHRRNDIDRPL